LPEIDRLAIVEVRIVVRVVVLVGVALPPTVTEVQFIVPPPVIKADVLAPAAFWSVILVIVRTIPELTVKVEVLELVLLKTIEPAVALATSTVSVEPLPTEKQRIPDNVRGAENVERHQVSLLGFDNWLILYIKNTATLRCP